MSSDLEAAPGLASSLLLKELPRRHAHVVGVGTKGAELHGLTAGAVDAELIEAAGYLHDIGYASALQDTGFHPVDGARFLRSVGYEPRVINLVAHHSCAHIEAGLRGLGQILSQEFPYDPSLPHDALCYCDMTTRPDGRPTTVEERLDDVLERYGPESIVHEAITRARADLTAAVRRTESRFVAT